MKKQTITVVAAILCAGSVLTGCNSGKADTTTPSTTEAAVTETVKETTTPAATTEPTVPETTVPETTTPATTAPAATETTPATTPSEPGTSTAASGKYIDLDNMQFTINGKTYTLGKTTLQEMIDDGVPFDKDDLANAGNNLNGNSQSPGFSIELGEYWSAQVSVLNDTEDNKKMSECYINEIYLPLQEGETQDVLSFSFPQNLTMEELKANAGEPTKTDHYDGDDGYYTDTLEYTKESTKYYGDSGYCFEFMKGKLHYITIEYTP